MSLPVLRRALVELRWQVVWYGVGLGAYASLMVWLFPSFEDTLQQVDYPEEYLKFFGGTGDLSQPSNFLATEVWSFAPIIFVIYAIVASTGLLAGDEGHGSLDAVLAQPVSRTRVLLEKAGAFVLGALAIDVLICAAWATAVPFVDLHGDLTLLEVWGATVAMLPLVWFYGALGFLAGALAPSRGLAAGALTVLAVAAYLVASFARVIQPIEWLQYLSPYYYADTARVLTDGVVWWHTALLLGGAVLAVALAALSFRGREIGAHVWQPFAWAAGR
ncbi:MAG: ABC transporter permease subunit [Dehalococcoidia bacterium]